MLAGKAMTREVRTVSPDATVAEAALQIRATGDGTLPVVDTQGRLLGVVTKQSLVRLCLPEYLEEVGDLYRSGEFPPFNEKVREVGLLPVRDVMVTDPLTASEDTPLAEVAALLITRHLRNIPILREGRLVGIIGLQDVIDRIAWPEPGSAGES
ncbi:MAG: CBS domain-containing protein [Armatimonadota bacterium]|nr:CBS domain-containing protein [Armatimonadota bacterium]